MYIDGIVLSLVYWMATCSTSLAGQDNYIYLQNKFWVSSNVSTNGAYRGKAIEYLIFSYSYIHKHVYVKRAHIYDVSRLINFSKLHYQEWYLRKRHSMAHSVYCGMLLWWPKRNFIRIFYHLFLVTEINLTVCAVESVCQYYGWTTSDSQLQFLALSIWPCDTVWNILRGNQEDFI